MGTQRRDEATKLWRLRKAKLGPWRGGGRTQRACLGAPIPRPAEVGFTHLLHSGSEGTQDGCRAPTVSLHARHGGLGMAQMGETG